MSTDAAGRLEIIQTLIRLRKLKRLTQTDVADKMGIGQPAVSEFERSAGNLKVETLQKYAQALGATLVIEIKDNDDGDI